MINPKKYQPRTNKRLLQNHDTLIVWIQRFCNAMIIILTLFVLAYWKDGVIATHYRYMAIISMLTMVLVYHYFGVNRRFESRLGGVQHLARAWGVVVIIVGWLGFLSKTTDDYSRQVIFLWVVIAFLLQAWIFPFFYWVHKRYQDKYGDRLIPSIVVGTDDIAKHLTSSINRNIWLPDRVKGVIALDAESLKEWRHDTAAALGTLDQIVPLIHEYQIRRVYIALPVRACNRLEEIQQQLERINVDIIWAPDIFSLNLLNPSIREMAGIPLISLSESPIMSGSLAFIKTLMDKVLAAIAIVLLSPVFLAVIIAIRTTSPGPIIFKQERHGWDGRIFKVWKFRSMYIHQPENDEVKQATINDPRVTPVGRFLRKTSLDELPQLFNVTQGTMSLVGPRPHATTHNEFYSDKVGAYLSRHRIKPGITGLAQINGFRGETETIEKMEQRIEYDLEYINSWSPWLDVKILLRTPLSLFTKNAY